MTLKIMQYNILHGFYSEVRLKHRIEREKAAVQVVKKENPDILILNEAAFNRKDDRGIYQDYKKMFKFPCMTKKTHSAIVILSKLPLKTEDYSIRNYGFLRSTFKLKGKEVMLDVIHPHPHESEHDRSTWIRSILRDMHTPYILAGDFNAISPQDKYNKRRLEQGFRKLLGKNTKNKVSEMLKALTIKETLKHELVDTYKTKNKEFNYTIPTDFCSEDKRSGIRVDYIFCSGDFSVLNSGIIKNKLTKRASDHYPVYAIIDI